MRPSVCLRIVSAPAAWLPALVVFSALAAGPVRAQDVGGIEVGSRAPAIAATDLAGRAVRLAVAADHKPALVEFWATWCEYCARLEPRMKQVYARYGGRVQFLAVAVNVNESLARVAGHTRSHSLPFQVVYDASGSATRDYDVPATSFVVVADATGRITYTGLGDQQDLEAALRHVVEPQHPGGLP